MPNNFFAAENSNRVGIREHAQNNSRIGFAFWIKRSFHDRTITQRLSLAFNPGSKGKWIGLTPQFVDNPGDLVKLNDFQIGVISPPLNHFRFMDRPQFHIHWHSNDKLWQSRDIQVTNR